MTPIERDYYEVLGVARNANAQQIHRAFRMRARQIHPDVSALADAGARFQELSTAYQVLRDPIERTRYDHAAAGRRPTSWRPAFTSHRERGQRFPGDDSIRLGPFVIRLSATLRWLS